MEAGTVSFRRIPAAMPWWPFRKQANYSATEIRANNSDKVLESVDFRLGVNYACQNWRYRSETNKILTMLFKTELLFGIPKPNDDIEAVGWFKVAELSGMVETGKITAEHAVLVNILLKNLNNAI